MKAVLKTIERAEDRYQVTIALDEIEATYDIVVQSGSLWTVRAEDDFWRAFEPFPMLAAEVLDAVMRFARGAALQLPVELESPDQEA